MSSPGVAVLDLVREHREKADVVAEYNPVTADTMRTMADEYERAVKDTIPEWWTLGMVRQAKPWSYKWLRRRCVDMESEGRARKSDTGRWEMRWDAVLELGNPQARLDPIQVAGEDLEALAEKLAAEG